MFHKAASIFLALMISHASLAEIQLDSYQSGLFKRPDVKLSAGERLFSRSTEAIIRTKQIPAKLGSKFGIRYQVRGKKADDNLVTYLYLTPGVEEPDGTRRDKYVETVKLRADVASHVAAFEFTEPYEIVEGLWELFIFVDDRLLIREQFNVSKGADALNNETLSPELISPLQYRVITPSR